MFVTRRNPVSSNTQRQARHTGMLTRRPAFVPRTDRKSSVQEFILFMCVECYQKYEAKARAIPQASRNLCTELFNSKTGQCHSERLLCREPVEEMNAPRLVSHAGEEYRKVRAGHQSFTAYSDRIKASASVDRPPRAESAVPQPWAALILSPAMYRSRSPCSPRSVPP